MAYTTIQTNFTSGELDPRLASRVDIQQYYNGAERLRNVIVNPLGGAGRSPGLEHIDELRHLLLPPNDGDPGNTTPTAPNGGDAQNALDNNASTQLITTNAIGTTNPYVVVHYDLGTAQEVSSGEIIGAATDIPVASAGNTGRKTMNSYKRDNTVNGTEWSEIKPPPNPDYRAFRANTVAGGEHTQYLRCTKRDGRRNDIPADATITGIEVRFLRRVDSVVLGNPNIEDHKIRLVVEGEVLGEDKASGANWGTSYSPAVYGGSSDLWGLPITRDHLMRDDFGVAISAKNTAGSGDWANVALYKVQIRVYYTTEVEASPDEFQMQYSTDNVAWNDYGSAFNVRDNDEVSHRHEQIVTARYWRFARIGSTNLGAAIASIRGFNLFVETNDSGDAEAEGLSSSRLIPFEFDQNQRYMLLFTDRNVAVYERGEHVTNVPSPYTSEMLDRVKYDQRLDTMALFHPDVPSQLLQRQSRSDRWVMKSMPFEYIPKFAFRPRDSHPGRTLTLSASEGAITITASSSIWDDADVGQYIRGNGGRARIDRVDTDTVAQATVITAFLNNDDLANGSWTLEAGYEDAWSDARGWPTSGKFYQNRLWIGGSRSLPDRVWGSRVFQFFDFNLGFGYRDDGIEAAIENEDVAGILSMNAGKNLQFFCKGAEFYVPQADTEALTPNNFTIKQTSDVGIKVGTPIVNVGSKVLFIQTEGQSVQEFSLHTGVDDTGSSYGIYSSRDITTLSSHLIDNPVDMAFRRSVSTDDPNIVLVVNEDGSLAILTKLDEHGVNAWTLRTTRGAFLNAGVSGDEIYFVVERTINGVNRRFLERFNDNVFLDGASVARALDAPASGASGLDYLEGEEVQVLLDSALQNPLTVTGGAVTFARDAEQTYQIGFGFDPLIRPMPVARTPDGARVLSGKKRIIEVLFFLYQTRWIEVAGPTGNSRPPGMQTFGPAPSPLDNVLQPFTGRKTVDGIIGWSEAGQVDITQGNIPVSLTLTGLEMQVMI